MANRIGALGRLLVAPLLGSGILPGAPLRSRARWSTERAAAWDEATPRLNGCNFVPSTASNQLELWQPATFDPVTIDRELGWAAQTLGMNSIRLFLHDIAWEVDRDHFLDRVDEVLEISQSHGIAVLPVLFDGVWDPDPRPGPQRAPRPGLHNSTWVQGPGASVLADPSRWEGLRSYVSAVLERFGTDERIIAWDLFNEPDSPNPAWAPRDPTHKARRVAELLDRVFDWSQDVDPAQPLTVGIYEGSTTGHPERVSRVARIALERSDVISFHCYSAQTGLIAAIDRLGRLGRPLLCTEWMARPRSPVRLAATLRDRGVHAWCWGLVDGRSQTKYPWRSWALPRRPREPTPWFHDLLHRDGTPYDPAEAELLRSLSPG